MTKRITISVPDELHAKMEEWKDSFNFSGIFQEAIRERIKRKEDFKRRVEEGESDMEAAVKRLKAEKETYYTQFCEEGKEQGFKWAMNAHYEDLQRALDWEVIQATLPEQLTCGDSPIKGAAYDIVLGDYEDLNFIDVPHRESFSLSEYADDNRILNFGVGWLEGVQEFWNKVKDRI